MANDLKQSFQEWYNRHFSNPEVVVLVLLLLSGFVLVYFFIGMLMPVFVALIISYVLDGGVKRLERIPMRRFPAVIIVFFLFMSFLMAVLIVFLPLLYREVALLTQEIPSMVTDVQEQIQRLSREYPTVMSPEMIGQAEAVIRSGLSRIGEYLIQVSLTSVTSIITIGIYLVLVPFVTFFFLKDKDKILARARDLLPKNSGLAASVLNKANRRFSDFIRGKIWEILIEWGITYLAFVILGLKYSLLLSFFVGLSVLIPYIGLILAALPSFLVALLQWGIAIEIVYLLAIFAITQIVASNIVSPLLFSEIVDLHPVIITIALLVFGEIWGIWGFVLAIPLATLIQTVVNALNSSVRREASR
jgi:putative permease